MIPLKNKYYKIRIIFTFALITILLVLTMSRISYYFVKDLYLQQLDDQLTLVSGFISEDLNNDFISLLEVGQPTPTLIKYLNKQVSKKSINDLQSEIFIFNSDMNLLYVAGEKSSEGKQYPELIFYEEDLKLLSVNENFTTIPFEGIDNNWYLYSFKKIGPDSFLGIKAPAVKFARIEEFDNIFWLLGIGGIVFIVFISWFLANSITRPVNELVKFSRQIGDNKLDTLAPEGMKGELAILSKSMDTMRKNILRNQKERENMLAQIAHEIRNPLGGIELLAGLTKEDLQRENLSDEYPTKILSEVTGLKKLITSYLSYSKPAPANPEDVEINELVDNIENVFKIILEDKNITLQKNITLSKYRFDRDQLKHVLMNLVANSIDSTDSQGTIEIKSYSVNGHHIISVSDDGPGINKDNMDKLFEPFFTTKKDGIGLGLAITRKYCEENNAEIKIDPAKGKGVTFKIIKEI
jgi:signal transduction histidine kinase